MITPAGRRCLLAIIFALEPVPGAGQSPEPGQRVRVTAPELSGGSVVAEFRRFDGDALVIERDEVLRTLPRASITSMEVSTGRHRHVLAGALVGGGAVGVVLGQDMLRKPGQCSGSGNYGQLCALFLTAAIAGGAAAGAIVGAFVRHDDWISVSFDAAHAGAAPGPGRHRLVLSVRFVTRR